MKKIEVCLRDNDPLLRSYRVGVYYVKTHLVPNEMYRDIFRTCKQHGTSIDAETIIDVFVDTLFDLSSARFTLDGSMILEMEVLDE